MPFMTISVSNCSSEFLIFSFQHSGPEQSSPDCASQQYRNDHFHQIARNKRDNACPQSLPENPCLRSMPARLCQAHTIRWFRESCPMPQTRYFSIYFLRNGPRKLRNQRQEQVAYQIPPVGPNSLAAPALPPANTGIPTSPRSR